MVRTSFFRDGSKTKSTDGNRVNLVLRFRSLLSRRAQQQKAHADNPQRLNRLTLPERRVHRGKVNDKRGKELGSGYDSPAQFSPPYMSVNTFEDSEESESHLKRASSDTCLCRSQIHSHAIYLSIPNPCTQSSDSAGSMTSPVSDQPDGQSSLISRDLPPTYKTRGLTQIDTEKSNSKINSKICRTTHVRRRSSLSTGNICCLYALRCLPSIEYLDNPTSPALARRRSLPVSSLKPFPHCDRDRAAGILRQSATPFALASLRHHPCYQDMTCNLRNWIKNTLSMGGSTESTLNEDADGNLPALTNIQDTSEWARHVRFADEATASSSATTLNSLSASSSARSLSSLVLTPNTRSPLGSLSSLDRGNTCTNKRTVPSNKVTSLHPLPRRLLKKFSQMGTSRTVTAVCKTASLTLSRQTSSPTRKIGKSEHVEKNKFMIQSIWQRRARRHRDRRTTPLVTVNLIQDYSEPPEVPKHVLNELEADVVSCCSYDSRIWCLGSFSQCWQNAIRSLFPFLLKISFYLKSLLTF